jgi:hypothetical protein
MVDGFSTMHHNNQGSFSPDEIDQKLEEGINCKSLRQLAWAVEEWELGIHLIYIADRIHKHCNLCRLDTRP